MKKIISAGVAVLILSFGVYAQKGTISEMLKAKQKERIVLISTSLGDIKLKLYNETPQHRDNFIKLVGVGFFDSTLFHRVMKSFMIQGGDPQSRTAKPGEALGNGDVGYTIPAEFNDSLFHKKGTLAGARQGDNVNPQKASSGCQFYIVQGKTYTDQELNALEASRLKFKLSPAQRKAYTTVGGTPWLDRDYTVFGEVIEGLDVVDKIAAVKTAPGDRPLEDLRMNVKIIQ